MSLLDQLERAGLSTKGEEIYRLASELYPICRSITGEGFRHTLAILGRRIPLCLTEVPSGTEVFDWTVPNEWNIRDAYIRVPGGERVVDFQKCNLHVVNYSAPVRATMRLGELKPRLHTLPDCPDLIPYRTAYYKEDWGFCLAHDRMLALEDREYEVCIDSTLAPGSLTYGEYVVPGRSSAEMLISCHGCHPSLANDNLSGVCVATVMAQFLAGRDLRYTYRFLFIPGTIGAIAWLARNQAAVGNIRHGLVLTCMGDSDAFHYKKSRRGNAGIDRAAAHVLRHARKGSEILEFSPYGYDERQYCSPGFDLPVGCLMRSVWGTFPQYHTSADNLDFIRPEHLAESLRVCTAILDVLENDRRYQNLSPYGEPQLGKRGLYPSGGGGSISQEVHARLWVLNLSDGQNSLLDIAERSGLYFGLVHDAADALCRGGLLSPLPAPDEAELAAAGALRVVRQQAR